MKKYRIKKDIKLLQENSKIHTSIEDVIEASHNSISTWENNNNFKPILLQGADDYVKTKERWKIIKEYFNSKKDRKSVV